MTSIFSPKVPEVKPAPAPPQLDDPEVLAAKQREQEQARMARGRSASLLTGGQGVNDDAPVERKRLLGA